MANPWDSDEIIGGSPWDADPVVSTPKPAAKPNFSDVRASVSSTETGRASRRTAKVRAQAEGEANRARIEYDRMQSGPGFLAGLGSSLADTATGIRQLGTEAVAVGSGDWAKAAEGLGMNRLAGAIRRNVTLPAYQSAQAQRADVQQTRADMEPMQGSVSGQLGSIAGGALQAILPGQAIRAVRVPAKMSAAKSALNTIAAPTTVRGNMLFGAGVGASQPVVSGDERTLNALAGGAAGAALPVIARGLSAGRNLLSGPAAAERRAAETILKESGGRPLNIAPSLVPGVRRTLGEATLDPGIMALERNARRTSPADFAELDMQNNLGRIRGLESFAGDESKMAQAIAERRRRALPLLNKAKGVQGVGRQDLIKSLDESIKANSPRPSVASALQDVRAAIGNAGDDVASLYQVRKYIDDLVSGKAGSDKSYARAARAELMAFKSQLDDKMAQASPDFARYLVEWRAGSAPIDRMKLGQRLMSQQSGGAVLDPQTGVQQLTPAQFSRQARDLDRVAAKVTGFKNARSQDILMPEDRATIEAIQDDLARQFRRAQNPAQPGSATMEAGELLTRNAVRSIAARTGIPIIAGIAEYLEGRSTAQMSAKIAQMIADPAEFQRVTQALSERDRKSVRDALIAISGQSGAVISTQN